MTTLDTIARRIASDDAFADKVGNALATELQLKKKRNGRYDLVSGDKSAQGLARTLIRVIDEVQS